MTEKSHSTSGGSSIKLRQVREPPVTHHVDRGRRYEDPASEVLLAVLDAAHVHALGVERHVGVLPLVFTAPADVPNETRQALAASGLDIVVHDARTLEDGEATELRMNFKMDVVRSFSTTPT